MALSIWNDKLLQQYQTVVSNNPNITTAYRVNGRGSIQNNSREDEQESQRPFEPRRDSGLWIFVGSKC